MMFWSIKAVVFGNLFGFLLAFFTSILITQNLYIKKYTATIAKIIVICLKALPSLIPLFLLTEGFGGLLGASLIIFWFTWLWLTRYLNNIYENANLKKYWELRRIGYSLLKAFYKTVLLEHKNKVFLYFLFSFESNLRWTSVLGQVGVYGIGFYINQFKNKYQYLGIFLIIFCLFIGVLELILYLSNLLVKYHFQINLNANKIQIWFQRNLKKIVFWIFILIYLIVFILTLADFSYLNIQWKQITIVLIKLFSFDFNLYNEKEFWTILLDTFKIIEVSFISTILGVSIAVVYAYFSAEKINNKWLAIGLKLNIMFWRIIPIMIIYYLFIWIFSIQNLIIFCLTVSVFRSSAKQISEFYNALNVEKIKLLRLQGFNKYQIFIKHCWPAIRKEVKSQFLIQFDNCLRNALIFSAFGGFSIGLKYSHFIKHNEIQYIFPLLLPLYVTFLILEFSNFRLSKRKI
ncbi:ABC transporter permease subunit [Mycoplasmopsis pullorum]|uniref:ABC transporter permease subunit n=3 Tax=Mycoplasmopsis pullorum TaxID=48003 RepID=UPI001118B9E6|nr:ABC transporter permease subunit [Mycoplasmopsis pullorum]